MRDEARFSRRSATLPFVPIAVAVYAVAKATLVYPAYFSPSWTAFQADGGRDFSVIVDGVSV